VPPIIVEDAVQKIKIRICGKDFDVPSDNSILRAFQHLGKIRAFTEFCWNGDCMNCKVDYRLPNGELRSGLACRIPVQPGMEILKIYSVFIKF
jgi:hypothetical protein